MDIMLVTLVALAIGAAGLLYGLLLSVRRIPEGERAGDALEGSSWRSRRTRGGVLVLMGSALVIGAVMVLLSVH